MIMTSSIVADDALTSYTAAPSRNISAGRRMSPAWTWALMAVLTIGIALRCWQYFANASIWLDEAAVARNVLDRHVLGLFAPLDYGQVAPPGFLLAVKLTTVVFGPAEWVLRLMPFVLGLIGLFVFPLVAQSLLDRPAALAATFMYATAIPLIFYSAAVKQYSGDVTACLVIVWAALRLLETTNLTRQRVLAFGGLGLVVLFFSQAAVFPLTAAGVVLVAEAFLRRREDKWTRFFLASIWAVEVLAAIANGYRSMTSVDRVYMHKYWAALFMPHGLAAAGAWLITIARTTFSGRMPNSTESLHYPFAVFGTLFLVSIVTLLWAHRAKGALIVVPIALAIAAAGVGAFPLATRVGLFMMPLYLLAVAHGTDTLSRMLLPRRAGAFGCLLLIPLAASALSGRLPPNRIEHIRPVLQYVATHRQPNDAVWVYYGAGQAFEYYQRVIPMGDDVQVGDCDRQNPRAYLHQVDVERGRPRVWFVIAHFAPQFRFDERGLVLTYLDAIGKRLDEFRAPDDRSPGVAAAYLYDLSAAATVPQVNANTFPIIGKFTPARWSCYGTASPIPRRNDAAVRAVMGLVK